jgi:hypothetical protein
MVLSKEAIWGGELNNHGNYDKYKLEKCMEFIKGLILILVR